MGYVTAVPSHDFIMKAANDSADSLGVLAKIMERKNNSHYLIEHVHSKKKFPREHKGRFVLSENIFSKFKNRKIGRC